MAWLPKQTQAIQHDGHLVIEGRSIPYSLRGHVRSRSIKIAVRKDGTVRISMPPRNSIRSALEFATLQGKWIIAAIERTANNDHISLPPDAPSKRYYESARAIVHARLMQFNQYYQFEYASVRIKDMNTRWGSCSSKGNLNFSYKLQFLPSHLIDYIIVHELCHLQELSHGPQFWALMQRTIPQAKQHKRELLATDVF